MGMELRRISIRFNANQQWIAEWSLAKTGILQKHKLTALMETVTLMKNKLLHIFKITETYGIERLQALGFLLIMEMHCSAQLSESRESYGLVSSHSG